MEKEGKTWVNKLEKKRKKRERKKKRKHLVKKGGKKEEKRENKGEGGYTSDLMSARNHEHG